MFMRNHHNHCREKKRPRTKQEKSVAVIVLIR